MPVGVAELHLLYYLAPDTALQASVRQSVGNLLEKGGRRRVGIPYHGSGPTSPPVCKKGTLQGNEVAVKEKSGLQAADSEQFTGDFKLEIEPEELGS